MSNIELPTKKLTWLVIDIRPALEDARSGISRYVHGLTTSFVKELHEKKAAGDSSYANFKILLVSKHLPTSWVVELVENYPNAVAYWNGGPWVLSNTFNRPSWLWSSLIFSQIVQLTDKNFFWLALANFDRPLFVSKTPMRNRILQVIHDDIPFKKLNGIGAFYKYQFRFLVKRALSRLPNILSVSQYSSKTLQDAYKKRRLPISVVSNAIPENFGSRPKIHAQNELVAQRSLWLANVSKANPGNLQNDIWQEIINSSWILGVGRTEKYKGWGLALKSVQTLQSRLTESDGTKPERSLWFIRVGAPEYDADTNKGLKISKLGEIKLFEKIRLIQMPQLSEEQLSHLYQISDLLLHPSQAEGFGLPPLEAALSGLPVIYRKGTAIDQHFEKDALPHDYWCGVDSNNAAHWATQMAKILNDKKKSAFYTGLLHAPQTRQYITDYSKCKSYSWKDSALDLLEYIVKAYSNSQSVSAKRSVQNAK